MAKINDIEPFLKSSLDKENIICDFHWNNIFLEFADKFCQGKTPKQTRAKFNYEAKKLVKVGYCTHSYDYLNGMDRANVGCRTINSYRLKTL